MRIRLRIASRAGIAARMPPHGPSSGETTTGTRWGLAEGESGGDRNKQTYILVANTSDFAGSARVTLLFEDGTLQVAPGRQIAANRLNQNTPYPTVARATKVRPKNESRVRA